MTRCRGMSCSYIFIMQGYELMLSLMMISLTLTFDAFENLGFDLLSSPLTDDDVVETM